MREAGGGGELEECGLPVFLRGIHIHQQLPTTHAGPSRGQRKDSELLNWP